MQGKAIFYFKLIQCIYTVKSNYGSTEIALLCSLNGYNGTGKINRVIQIDKQLNLPLTG